MSRAILDSSPVGLASGIPAPRRSLKRSASAASIASLPTPPRTVESKRGSRSRSRGSDRDATPSDHDEESDEGQTRTVVRRVATRLNFRKRQRMNTDKLDAVIDALSGADAENPFWDGPHATDVDEKEETRSRSPSPALMKFNRAPVSPPPSRRQTQTHAPTQPPRTPKASNATASVKRNVEPQPIRDSPHNPFLDDSPASISGDPAEPRTPTDHTEKPTITYVFRGVKTTFANPLYSLSPSAHSRALLPVDHPDFEPDEACPPKLLFPSARSQRRPSSPSRDRNTTPTKESARDGRDSDDYDGWDESGGKLKLDFSPPKRLFQTSR